MRIVHLITTLDRGGAETQLVELVERQLSNGHVVSIFFLQGKGALVPRMEELGATVGGCIKAQYFVAQYRFLKKWLRDIPAPDVIHCHLPRAELLGLLTLKGKIKTVVSRHNAEPFWPGVPKLLSNLVSRRVTHNAESVICISEAVKNYVVSNREILSDERDKLVVIPYGISGNTIDTISQNGVVRNSNTLRLVTVSRLVEQKDLPTMISGIADYSRNYSCQLTLIGQGPLKDSLKQYSESLSISDSIIWKDEIEHVVPFLAGFDLFVLSSKYEGFGMVLLESMLAKLPIIAAANEAVREVLGDNFPGLFEVGSATSLSKKLEEFSSPIARNSLLTKQEEILKKYDSVYMANSIEKVYLS